MVGCGEKEREAIRPEFNRSIMIDIHGVKINSDTGFLLLRERYAQTKDKEYLFIIVTSRAGKRAEWEVHLIIPVAMAS
jgi:hypothetical protein